MSTAQWDCPASAGELSCPASNSDASSGVLLADASPSDTEVPRLKTDDGSTDVPPLSDPYAYSGDPSRDETGASGQENADRDAALQKLGQLDQSDTLQQGMVLYDIAREALAARGAITGEESNHDAIMRECNRIMVLNGYPDAQLESKTNITMADLPRAWNGVRWDQEFKLYDEAALNTYAGLTVKNGASPPEPQLEPEPEPEPEPKPGPESDPHPNSGPEASIAAANEFFICQFRDAKFNPSGPPSSNDCGPASLAMIARYYDVQFDDAKFGHIDGSDADPEQLVNSVRYLMTGGRDVSELTGLGQMDTAAKALGLKSEELANIDDLNTALDAGHMVVLAGNPKDYQKDLGLHYGKGGTIYDGGHFITVVGRNGDNYIVNDPANHGGAMELTPQQISTYIGSKSGSIGRAIYRDEPMAAEPVIESNQDLPDADSRAHMQTVDGFRADQHPDLNLDLRGFSQVSGLPPYASDTGPTDSKAPQLASLFGADHAVDGDQLPSVRSLYRVSDWNWNDSVPKSQGKGSRGNPITDTEVTMLGFESRTGEPIYLPESGYRVDGKDNQGQILYLDRSKGEVTIAYNTSGTVAGGYTLHLRGVDFDASLEEGGLVSSSTPLGTARGNELLVSMTDRGTFMDIRLTNHWWQRRNRR